VTEQIAHGPASWGWERGRWSCEADRLGPSWVAWLIGCGENDLDG
jgi:hypothetical protein